MALALEKQRHPRMRIITRTHGYDLYNERSPAGVQPYKRFMDRHMDAVFFVSRQACAYYKKHFATQDNGHYQLAYLGVPDNGLNPPGRGEEISLFSCSNIIPIKRVGLLVEALSLLRAEDPLGPCGRGQPGGSRPPACRGKIGWKSRGFLCSFWGCSE